MGGMRCLIGGPAPVDLKKGDSYPLIHLKKNKETTLLFLVIYRGGGWMRVKVEQFLVTVSFSSPQTILLNNPNVLRFNLWPA